MCALCVYRQSPFMTQSNVRPGIWAPTSLYAKRMCWARERGNIHHKAVIFLLTSDATLTLKYHRHTLSLILIHRQTLLFYLYFFVCLLHILMHPQGGGGVSSGSRVEPLCSCWHVFVCSGWQHWYEFSQQVSGKAFFFFRILVVTKFCHKKLMLYGSSCQLGFIVSNKDAL